MIPTVNVTVAVHEQDGSPVRDALVLAKLTAVERYNGYVVADEYTGRTDERGRAVVAVFPNELGSEGSEYRFRIVTPAGKTFSVYATVPNSDCNLHQICELEPSERRGAGQVVSTEMAGYVTQAETARDKSQEAANRRRPQRFRSTSRRKRPRRRQAKPYPTPMRRNARRRTQRGSCSARKPPWRVLNPR